MMENRDILIWKLFARSLEISQCWIKVISFKMSYADSVRVELFFLPVVHMGSNKERQ